VNEIVHTHEKTEYDESDNDQNNTLRDNKKKKTKLPIINNAKVIDEDSDNEVNNSLILPNISKNMNKEIQQIKKNIIKNKKIHLNTNGSNTSLTNKYSNTKKNGKKYKVWLFQY